VAKKGKKGASGAQNDDFLASLGVQPWMQEEDAGESADDGGEEGEKGDKTPDVTALLARLEALEAQNERLSRERTLYSGTQTQHQAPEPPQMPEIDMEGMPDPLDKPQEYQKELNARISAAIGEHLSAQSAYEEQVRGVQMSQKEQVDALWADFNDQYPDLAEHSDLVEFAAQKVVQRAVARKMDPQRYMFGTPDLFFSDIEKEVKKKFGTALSVQGKDDEGDDGEEEEVPQHATRTRGMFGGAASGGKPTGKWKGTAETPGDMIAELQEVQGKLRIY
jgi:hypothetical protein